MTRFSWKTMAAVSAAAAIAGSAGWFAGAVTPSASGGQVADAAAGRDPAVPAAAGERKVRFYRNPMGLPDVSPVPKKDSMGMDYIPVYEDEASGPSGTVRISLDKVQRAGVRTEPVARRLLTRTVRGFGLVTPQESRLAVVTARFGGFVEELYVPLTGTEVRSGTPIARIWIESPEILKKQADFLTALRGGRPADAVAAEGNLRLFGIPEAAIEQMRRSGESVRSIVLTAPAKGTVMEKPAVIGMRFEPGDALFKMADLSVLWVMAQVAERDLAALRPGQPVRIAVSALGEASLSGKVGFIYPDLDMATRTARVRIDLPNPDGRLKAGLYAEIEIDTPAAEGAVLAVPVGAVLDSGRRRVAFVARDEGTFEPRDLVLGARSDGLIEVRSGLAEGERVVVRGNFLIDAESNLRSALSTFTAPAPEAGR